MSKTVGFLIISILFLSCHSLVEEEFQKVDKKPVLNAVLQSDSIIKVHVSFPQRLDGLSPVFVDNASVVISSSEGWDEELFYTANGWYYSTHYAKMGVDYICKLSIPEFNIASASTILPYSTPIYDIRFIEHAGLTEEGALISSVHFTIENKPEKEMFWEVFFWEIYDNDDLMSIDFRKSEIYMTAGQDKVLLNEALPLTVFSNKFMDNSYEVTFYFSEDFVDIKNQSKFFIELRSVDKSYYNFQKQKYLYDTAGDTGLGSSVQTYPLYSNIMNGYGIFTSYSSTFEPFNYNE